MKAEAIKLNYPTSKLVDEYLDKFNQDKRYYQADIAIKKLFEKLPNNNRIEDVLLKTTALNRLYSTNIYDVFLMAEHICSRQIDDSLRKADPAAVHKIAEGHGITKSNGEVEIKFYSFATKYCSWHKENDYPIYDSFVRKILVAYRKDKLFSNFKEADFRSFESFKQVIFDFREYYKLQEYSLKEIDKFLWRYGQEKFPNKKKNRTTELPHQQIEQLI